MPVFSAGLLAYRFDPGGVCQVLLAHPGGPLWAKKDDGAWSVPKGEYDPVRESDALHAAEREFAEEIGQPPPPGPRTALGELRQPSGKRVSVWAVEGDVDVSIVTSNTFEMEWPPRSGRRQSFPEVDRAQWCSLELARRKLTKGQAPFIDRLRVALNL